jgi:dihydrodipicolinate synthase/N-acetylneuraminate lyase
MVAVMQTRAITQEDLRRSVIAVPPLCRGADFAVDEAENVKLIRHMEAGGVSTLLYGGNAIFYHISLAEYAGVLEFLAKAVAEDTLVVPAVGPMYGTMMDQASVLKDMDFPTAMLLPTLFPSKPEGVATAIRHFVERSGKPAVVYMKDPGYITPELVAKLVEDGLISWIKYAIVKEDPADDPILRRLTELVDAKWIVSGIGEQPALVHLRDFGCGGFTAGCVCVAPRLSTQMLQAIVAGDEGRAEALRVQFLELEDLRNAHSPILVLHHAVALAGIADTGTPLPLLEGLPSELIAPIEKAAKELLAAEMAARA